ncbi:hypothetical protein SF12_06415 [Streptomyces sp. MBRL 601]|nr:hypothetical protein SF12_06415 [Streptomyces sp. MBRL 601]
MKEKPVSDRYVRMEMDRDSDLPVSVGSRAIRWLSTRPLTTDGERWAMRVDVPTYEVLPRFAADLDRLFEQQCCFHRAVTAFVQDLRGGGHFRAGLREARGFAYSWRGQPLNRASSPP